MHDEIVAQCFFPLRRTVSAGVFAMRWSGSSKMNCSLDLHQLNGVAGRLDLHQLNGVAWQQVTLWHPRTVLTAQVGSALVVHRVLILRTGSSRKAPSRRRSCSSVCRGQHRHSATLRCSKVCSALWRPRQGSSYGEGRPTSPDPRPPRR